MSEVKQLQQWSDFLDAQMAHFDDGIMRESGGPHVAEEVNTAFLTTDEDLVRPAVEEAVKAFVRDGVWPQKMSKREYLHLIFRAYTARGAILIVLLAILDGSPVAAAIRAALPAQFANLDPKPVAGAIRAQLPPLDDRERMIHWLFIESWNKGGKRFLEAMTNDFLKNVLPGRSDWA